MTCVFSTLDNAVTLVHSSGEIDIGQWPRILLAPDGSVSPYYPAAAHLNCNLTLRKITLLSDYYDDVRNISTSHVITADYTMLPIGKIITEGYSKYQNYSCNGFYWDYSK